MRRAGVPSRREGGAAEGAVLRRLRTLCLDLPAASETTTFGHPTFQVTGRTFAVLERFRGRLCIVFKAEPLEQQALVERDGHYLVAPYVGKHGWVSMVAGARMDWRAVRRHVAGSWRLVGGKRALARAVVSREVGRAGVRRRATRRRAR
jgi:predicted DNA-binding protein (MmcQ/YjbR family)